MGSRKRKSSLASEYSGTFPVFPFSGAGAQEAPQRGPEESEQRDLAGLLPEPVSTKPDLGVQPHSRWLSLVPCPKNGGPPGLWTFCLGAPVYENKCAKAFCPLIISADSELIKPSEGKLEPPSFTQTAASVFSFTFAEYQLFGRPSPGCEDSWVKGSEPCPRGAYILEEKRD